MVSFWHDLVKRFLYHIVYPFSLFLQTCFYVTMHNTIKIIEPYETIRLWDGSVIMLLGYSICHPG